MILNSIAAQVRNRLTFDVLTIRPFALISHHKVELLKTDRLSHRELRNEAQTIMLKSGYRIRERMIAANYPNINDMQTIIEFAIILLEQHPELGLFTPSFITNPLASLDALATSLKACKLQQDRLSHSLKTSPVTRPDAKRRQYHRRPRALRRAPIPRQDGHVGK